MRLRGVGEALTTAQSRRQLALAVAAVAALLALVAASAPTGQPAFDAALRVVLALAFVGCSIAAGPGARLGGAAIVAASLLVSPSVGGALAAWSALALAAYGYAVGSADPLLGASIGLGVGQGALRIGWSQPTGGSAAVTAAALAVLAAPVLRSLHTRDRRYRWTAIVVAACGGAALIFSAGLALSALAARSSVHDGIAATRVALDASRRGDRETASRSFDKARRAFTRAHQLVDAWWTQPVRVLPVVAQYRSALVEVTASGEDLAATGAHVARAADPSVTLAKGRVSLAAVRALEPPLTSALAALERSAHRLAGIDTTWLLPPFRTDVHEFDRRIGRGIDDVKTGIEAARVLPALLGGNGSRRYFVAFQTPAEQRASGGIIGNYAVVSFTDGRFDLVTRGRDSDLNEGGTPNRTLVGPADYLRRYAQFDPQETWQNVTMSPDFPSVARVVEHLYPESGGTPVDGVVTLDPRAVAAILRLTGPVRVADLPFALTASNAEQFLLRDQYERFSNNGDRIDFLGEAIDAIVHKLKTVDLPPPARIADVLGPVVREGRLALHSVRPDEQHLFATMGADAALPPVRGDFVGLVTQNASGNKIDVFQRRSLHDDVMISPETGDVEATVTVTLFNDAPRTGLPHYVIGGSGSNPTADGDSRVYVTLYSPLALQRATIDGRPHAFDIAAELGRNTFSTFVLVPSRGSVTLRLHLAGRVLMPKDHDAQEYSLAVWRQPTIRPDGVEVRVATARGTLSPGPGLRPEGSGLLGQGLPHTSTTYFARLRT